MHPIYAVLPAVLDLTSVVTHAGARPTPVPHWVVLLVGVVGLWVVICGGVIAVESLLTRLSSR